MPLLPDLKQRDRQPELMDQPELDVDAHHGALRGLQRVNGISFGVKALWSAIRRSGVQDQGQPLRILDVASGGGDVAIGVWKQSMADGIPIEITGIDVSSVAVEYAREKAGEAGAPIDFLQGDVVTDGLPGRYDIVCCSLFVHHLEEPQAVALLTAMRESAEKLVVVSDLLRTRLGYALCWIGTRLLTRSPVVHTDGLLSVRAALSLDEARGLAAKAGLQNARFERQWPQRFLMTWSPS